jgi:photosystem II stability/assembly factor-like uncharacterized protein
MKKERKSKIIEKLITFIFYLSVLLFFIGFNFQDNKMNGWFPQYLPSVPPVKQLVFLDSLTGYILSGDYTGPQYLLKTTNGGNNWSIFQSFGDTVVLDKIQFINRDSIVLCSDFALFKSTNGGNSWLYYPFPLFSSMGAADMYALSMDSIWIAGDNGMNARLYLTTNGGLNWTTKFSDTRSYFDKIYFFNRRIGFTCLTTTEGTFKTTNGGDNWFSVPERFYKMFFADSLTGWKRAYTLIQKTTNGGLNWVNQTLPSGGIIFYSGLNDFSVINKDTLWGCGGVAYSGHEKGVIYKTTNGGTNWGYQIPDTNLVKFHLYALSSFVNKNIGWEYIYYIQDSGGVHTTVGGSDTTYFTNIKEQITNVSSDFVLYQNYPNPFNPISSIKYKVSRRADLKIIVFDITGKEIITLINKKQSSGIYEVKFDGSNLPSGIYFYSLFADGIRVDTKKAILIK